MSDCSPPGVSQMSVNIQLFPLHLTLISLWWHFISLPLAVLVGKRSAENSFFVLFIASQYKKMQIQNLFCAGVEAGSFGFVISHVFVTSWRQIQYVPNKKWSLYGTAFSSLIAIVVLFCLKTSAMRGDALPPTTSCRRPVSAHVLHVGADRRSLLMATSLLNLFFSLCCVSIQIKTSCQSK